ncbi:MAG: PorV/PorQ family protein [Fidelibacterota bacterium]|nr:MAG: PorV/PorQ family protein [Candidatus Neomarinimicrobiota bacterium]
MNRIYLALVLASLSGSLVFAQETSADQKVGMTGADFLSIGVGARAAGLGEAYVALANDASAVFWNPAGLTRNEGGGAFASYTQWPADIVFSAAAVAFDAGGIGKVAVHYLGMQMGQMRMRTPFSPDGTGEMFSYGSTAAGISWARSLTAGFGLGFNLKYIRESAYTISSQGWAIDIGSIFDTGWRGMKIGMAMTNFGPDIAFDGTYSKWSDVEEPGVTTDFESYALPMAFRFGATVDVMRIDASGIAVVLVADAVHPPDNVETYNFGLELTVLQMLNVRAGYRMGVDEGGLTAGAGVNVPFLNASADIAYSTFGLLGSVMNTSLSLNF